MQWARAKATVPAKENTKNIGTDGYFYLSDESRKRADRQRSSQRANKSFSDSELAQGKNKGRKGKSKEKWPLLEGLTVDELVRYRRRRVEGQPKDNLGLCPEAEGNDLVSEYGEAFRPKSEELLKENTWVEINERHGEPFLKNFIESEKSSDEEALDEQGGKNIELPSEYKETKTAVVQNNDRTMETDNVNSNIISHSNRPSLTRRRSTLKRNGEFYPDTETYSAYVAYEGQHRPELARRPTSLKMEGDMDTMTEKCEKFIEWLNVSRPELMRVPTHLKLEGDFESSTENHDKYVPFVGVRRPELLRRNTNLKLEGEFNFLQEYADEFKKHDNRERLPPMKPENHLNAGKNLYQRTENTDKVNNNSRVKEAQLRNESKELVKEEEEHKRRKEMEMNMLISKLEDLKSQPLEVPEYKDAYKDFPRERPKIIKPEDEIGRADGSKIPSSPTHKFSAKIDQDPEYKSKYLDYQRDYPVYRKPPPSVRSTLIPPDHSPRFRSRRHDYELTSEVQSQYVPYGRIPRVETLKMPANLRLEGNIDLEPEYRTAYCTKRDYQLCTEPRMYRRRDRSLSASRQKENYWINSNTEQFGFKNAAQAQDAFQIVNTRVHEDTICEKPPPPISRRGSRSSQIQVQRPMQSDTVECNTKNQSTSPTYRLHVCNVDDEQAGFRRRRSPLQSSGRIRNPSPNRMLQSDATRPYSPSFGKTTKQHNNDQSFVILDNRIFDTNKNEIRRRRADRNYNIDSILSHPKGKSRTSTNWMPPWYDSTNTI